MAVIRGKGGILELHFEEQVRNFLGKEHGINRLILYKEQRLQEQNKV